MQVGPGGRQGWNPGVTTLLTPASPSPPTPVPSASPSSRSTTSEVVLGTLDAPRCLPHGGDEAGAGRAVGLSPPPQSLGCGDSRPHNDSRLGCPNNPLASPAHSVDRFPSEKQAPFLESVSTTLRLFSLCPGAGRRLKPWPKYHFLNLHDSGTWTNKLASPIKQTYSVPTCQVLQKRLDPAAERLQGMSSPPPSLFLHKAFFPSCLFCPEGMQDLGA